MDFAIHYFVPLQMQQYMNVQDVYNTLKLRSNPVEAAYGEGRSDPKIFGEMVVNTPIDTIERVSNEILKDLRLLPNLNKFKQQIQDWSSDAAATASK